MVQYRETTLGNWIAEVHRKAFEKPVDTELFLTLKDMHAMH
jgi:hypothetical protein